MQTTERSGRDAPEQVPAEPRTTDMQSRRALMRAALGSAAALAAMARTTRAGGGRTTAAASFPDRDVSLPDGGDVLLLVNRVTQGFRAAEYETALAMGYDAYLDSQLAWQLIDDASFEAGIAASFPTLAMTPQDIVNTYGMIADNVAIQELKAATVLRSVGSPRQLRERMAEFWSDHFNVDHLDGNVRILKTADDRDVIRPNVVGRFPTLLGASARSGAMLHYLDNYTNVDGGVQENYSRELMELHTLGVDGPYDEDDVVEVAKCLTGWGYRSPASGAFGDFQFRNSQHTPGPKTVLGLRSPISGGINDGVFVLDLLANHASTAEFVSRKLIRWLLTDAPSDSLVNAISTTFLQTGGDIKKMVRAILSRANLREAAPRFKRPLTFAYSLVRALDLTITGTQQFGAELSLLGQLPFGWPAPNGYPDSIFAWGSNVLPRWDFASRALAGQVPGLSVDPAHVQGLLAAAAKPTIAEAIDYVLTGGAMDAEDVAEVQAYVDSFPTPNWLVLREAIALAASSPSYQFH